MADVSMGELLARSAVSLAVVLALVLGAYGVLRRRTMGPVPVRRRRAAGAGGVLAAIRPAGRPRTTTGAAPSRTGRTNRNGLRVVGRTTLGRSTVLAAVQFGERVLLVGAADQGAPSVLAELDSATWSQCSGAVREQVIPATAGALLEPADAGVDGQPAAIASRYAPAPRGLLDALREATTRRG